MALVYIDGFDWIINNQLTENYAGRWSNTGGIPSAAGVDRITDTASGTGAAVRLQGNQALSHGIDGGALTTGYLGFRFRTGNLSSVNQVLELKNSGASSGVHILIRVNSSGLIEVLRGTFTILATGSTTISTNTWYYLEFKWTIDNSTGVLEVRIDGSTSPEINLTSTDTQNGGTANVDAIELLGDNANLDYDDLYLDDAQFHGDVYVETVVPDGAGSDSGFTPSAGSNWAAVDELPPDGDTTYVESATATTRDRHTHTNLPADTDTVLGVQVGIYAKKDVAGDRDMRVLAYDGTTEGESANLAALGTTYEWRYAMFEDHPTSAAAWTESEVNGGQFGYKVQA